MFRSLYKNPGFVGAKILPPNEVLIIMDDGISQYKLENIFFDCEATLDKQEKELKAFVRDEYKILDLFITPTINKRGRFSMIEHKL